MTTTPQTESSSESDASLWKLVRQGSEPAFEVLVRRYQSLICSVAYSTCGNLALSEEVAQETLWTAWRQRIALDQPDRLRFWLCGIARNLAKNASAHGRRGRSRTPSRSMMRPNSLPASTGRSRKPSRANRRP